MVGVKNEKAPNWKGENVSVSTVHLWLATNYGRPNLCEEGSCKKKSNTYDWALKTGLEYSKNRESFRRLCRSCHRKYDLTEEKKVQAIKNLIKHNPHAHEKSYDNYRKLAGGV